METFAALQLPYKPSFWFTENASLVLEAGRIVFQSGSRQFKVGDGITALSSLLWYDASGAGSAIWGSITGNITLQTDLNNVLTALDTEIGTVSAAAMYRPVTQGVQDNIVVFDRDGNAGDGGTNIAAIDAAIAAKYDASNVEYVEDAFSGTITWTGSAAPSGATNHRVMYSKIGKQVSAGIYLNYASAGTALTNILLTDLSQLPTPAFPNGWDVASAIINRCLALAQTSQTAASTATAPVIRKNSGNTSWEIAHTTAFTSGNYRYFQVFLNYICV